MPLTQWNGSKLQNYNLQTKIRSASEVRVLVLLLLCSFQYFLGAGERVGKRLFCIKYCNADIGTILYLMSHICNIYVTAKVGNRRM